MEGEAHYADVSVGGSALIRHTRAAEQPKRPARLAFSRFHLSDSKIFPSFTVDTMSGLSTVFGSHINNIEGDAKVDITSMFMFRKNG
jgi:hypothetical protein